MSTSTQSGISIGLASRLLGLTLWLLFSRLALAQQITTVAGGNGEGSAANQLSFPTDVYVDGTGNRYVADQINNRVQKFPPNSTSATAGITVAGGNGVGSAANQLSYPIAVYVDGLGNLYVSDPSQHRVQKFPPNSTSATAGVTVAGGTGEGSAPNQLRNPTGVYVDGPGNLYVTDSGNNRVQQFPPNSTSATAGATVAGGNGAGSAANQLSLPNDVSMDGTGNLYVTDYYNNRVQKFPPNSTSATAGITVAGGNGMGAAANQLNGPDGLTVDGAGNLYVADYYNNRLQHFPPNSTSATVGITVAGGYGEGSAPNQLNGPNGLYVDGLGNLYTTDYYQHRIQRYRYAPRILSQPVASLSACAGATITAQVSATATIPGRPFTYQWYSASGLLTSQTSPILSLTNVQAGDATSYYVIISSTNGLSTASTTFTLSVLAKPTVSLVASGPLSPTTPTVTLTASGGGTYLFSPGATQIGNGPTATVSAPGVYSVLVTGTNGCSNVASTNVTPAPELSLLLYARPTGLYGNTAVTVVVDVIELNGAASSGLITLKITQDTKLSLNLPASATSIDNRPVNNSVWQLSGPSNGYYTLTTSQVIAANGQLSVGLTGSFSPDSSSGELTVSGTLVGGSGGDQRLLNNTDADRLDYFQQ